MAGRPTLLTQELADEICDLIAQGKSLRQIQQLDGMPERHTIRIWVSKGSDGNETYRAFHTQYTRSCQLRAEVWAEDMLEISDHTQEDKIFDEYGNEKVDHEHINRSRLRVDTRKWLLSKVLPKIYGDKITQEHTGPEGKELGFFSNKPPTAREFEEQWAPKPEEADGE